jgi:methylmalonyl-CoA mutase N-terminal domain/subunit
VGKCGVAIDTLADMERLFDGITLEDISTSMTINATASILLAMYLAVAEKQGADLRKITGTLQNDILKEYIAQKEFIYPPRPSMRLITDTFAFCAERVPKWNSISISGYHIREAGSTALQELAFTLRDGMEYVEYGRRAGLEVDAFAPRLSFFFNAHNDFFEEIGKYRAARRIWAKVMRERYGAKKEESWRLRFHAQTAGCSLTAQQPYNNVVRTALQALAAVLGGAQSLHTNSMDETYALPTEEAVTIALRTQQVLAHESGVANTIDPLGGSYFVEWMTNEMEKGAFDYFGKIDRYGGMVEAVEAGFPQREIMNAAYTYQKALDRTDKIVDAASIPLLKIDESIGLRQMEFLRKVKAERGDAVRRTLDALKRETERGANTMPLILDCVKAYATVEDIAQALAEVFGSYREQAAY